MGAAILHRKRGVGFHRAAADDSACTSLGSGSRPRQRDRKGSTVTSLSPSNMADVAQRAGVSISTVSRAIRGSDLVSAATAERVRHAAAELDFAVSRAASSLASGRLDRVAVLLSGSLSAWFNGSLL